MSNTRRAKAEAPCHDCGAMTFRLDKPCEYYVVTDDIWAEAGMDPTHIPWYGRDGESIGDHYFLCIGCLETRLGRELVRADFKDAPVNNMTWRMTPRLRDRLTRRQP